MMEPRTQHVVDNVANPGATDGSRVMGLEPYTLNRWGGADFREGQVRIIDEDGELTLFAFTPAPALVERYHVRFSWGTPTGLIQDALRAAIIAIDYPADGLCGVCGGLAGEHDAGCPAVPGSPR